MQKIIKILSKIILVYIIFSLQIVTKAEKIGSETGYKIPRFVSLKSNESNLRIGSSKKYPIILKYITKNLPLEIIEENGQWRKIKDFENNVGWIHESIIMGDRYAIINHKYDALLQILNKPKGKVIWKIGQRNIVKIKTCLIEWCYISYEKNLGWTKKENLWGVYQNEKLNVPFYQFIINRIWKINL